MDDIIDKLTGVVPPKWKETIMVAAIVLPLAGRAYHALTSGGGLVGVYKAIVFGTNTPKKQDETKTN